MNRAGVVAAAAAVGVGKIALRARLARWGATDAEVRGALPGDDLVGRADVAATRAITVHAPAAAVWPWIAQLGQGRTGMYIGAGLGLIGGAVLVLLAVRRGGRA
jgi:hypothetical protein